MKKGFWPNESPLLGLRTHPVEPPNHPAIEPTLLPFCCVVVGLQNRLVVLTIIAVQIIGQQL